MRCGSDTESALLLLISTEGEGREGGREGGPAAGLRDDGPRGGESSRLFLGH